MGNEITSYVFDASMKRIYLGDNTGRIKNFNMSHGNYLKDFAPHSKEICNLAYSDKNALLISLSEDQVIKFHEDAELLETTILKEINLSQMNVKTIATSETHSRMLIGLGNGPIFPNMTYLTPVLFGEEVSQSVIGIQMAFSYLSIMLSPVFFGALAQNIGIFCFVPFLSVMFVMMAGMIIYVKCIKS